MTPGSRTWHTLPEWTLVLTLVTGTETLAQFSPGELSRAHSDLEGITNCVRCHEVGTEISGAKCLDCHGEIGKALSSGHGFHATVASQRCVQCHKEHLGLDAGTVVISRKDFDHARTGFALTGRHRSLRCEECHRTEFVKDKDVLELMTKKGRASVLGLNTRCASCHEDRHRQTLGTECQTCHTAESWKPAVMFDHGKTAFRLAGKHEAVDCAKCHIPSGENDRVFELPPARIADCTPYHTSPHRQKMAELCSSCHTPTSWTTIASASFNHDMTPFPLRGRHASVRCEQCHQEKRTSAAKVRVCKDCHADSHRGEFLASHGNDCAVCHSAVAFSPSTFTLEMHDKTRFALTGAHTATVCSACHRASGKELRFHFAGTSCTTCHNDPHAGQFATGETVTCASCHTTSTWKLPDFEHSKTQFALSGKHLTASCTQCHKTEIVSGVETVRYAGTPATCESCHTDSHAGQFTGGTNTSCSSCHSPDGWPALVFDHNKQSSFSLTGGHANVTCRRCHVQESIGGKVTVRYKPLQKECQHCHAGRTPDGR